MRKVYQSITDGGKGDCMRAAVASMLDLEIEMVPHFIRFNRWHNAYLYFLALFGIEFNGTGIFNGGERIPSEEDGINGVIMATVPSLNFNGKTHSILIDVSGKVLHDPSLRDSYAGRNVIEDGSLLHWDLLSFCDGRPALPNRVKVGDIYIVPEES